MKTSPDDAPDSPISPDASIDRLEELQARCRADREHLLKLASYAEAFVNAAQFVKEATERADALLAAARDESARIRAAAADVAERLLTDARQQRDRFETEPRPVTAEVLDAAAIEPVPQRAEGQLRSSETADLRLVPKPTLEPSPAVEEEAVPQAEAAPHAPPHHLSYVEVMQRLRDTPSPDAAEAVEEFLFASEGDSDRRSHSRWWPVGAAAAVVLVVAAGVLWRRAPVAAPTPAALAAVGPVPTGLDTPATPPSAPTAPAATPVSSTASTSATPAAEPASPRLSVAIHASRRAWVRVGVDGTIQPGGFIRAGERRVLTGDRAVEVRTGDAGALLVSVNGGAESPLGSNGAVLTKRFTPDTAALPATTDGEPRSQDARAQTATPAPGATAPIATAGVSDARPDEGGSIRDQIASADRRWFEAFYVRNAAALSALQAPGFELADERPAAVRHPAGQPAERVVQGIQIDTWGDNAVASGVMVERRPGGDEVMSVFTETWVRRGGRWQLTGLRLKPSSQEDPAKPR